MRGRPHPSLLRALGKTALQAQAQIVTVLGRKTARLVDVTVLDWLVSY